MRWLLSAILAVALVLAGCATLLGPEEPDTSLVPKERQPTRTITIIKLRF